MTEKERAALPTKRQVEQAKTKRGGWRRQTLAQWGVPWPPPKGWRSTLEKMRSGQCDRPRGWNGPVQRLWVEPSLRPREDDPPPIVQPKGTLGSMLRYYELVSLQPLRYKER